ncbi:rRNA biogenesis protein rrp5 [Clostridium botulinum]|uniref:rRNA biogenesis protein rrp5 n=1 Tax=Clostridium botulinum C/D str. DC5 TaxID=1443128 RepID=A0A0A0IEZ2_CLOBO|nr:hypothetical protein [Clostridium botulinum]KGM99557.1 hypothetical protein Z955_06960 [Clostridium botulinum C/D str. DC5]MCD3234378.1 rRNA biogenesis protein rrp5 [Clostridium botulinum D/C]MCD3240203.1 rRNA biogenesis protein rrp5 [Clostridium botulinum D/C]MCD3267384.1 rRNA biogenesis protein rrp5 [Clostridium botulinum D/C]MCD3299346.1 rRNA biogenesis protein rrp5 [Clostridium botulinum D/C]
MNVNIDINIKASQEVTNSILTLAAVLHNAVPIFDESSKNIKPKGIEKEVQAPKENIKDNKEELQKPKNNRTEETKEISLEEVRGVLAKLSKDGKQSEVKALIKKFGGKKLTDISKDKYSELLKETEMI